MGVWQCLDTPLIVMTRGVRAAGETRDTANILQCVGQASPLPQQRPVQLNVSTGTRLRSPSRVDGQQAVEKRGVSRLAVLLPGIHSLAAPRRGCVSQRNFSRMKTLLGEGTAYPGGVILYGDTAGTLSSGLGTHLRADLSGGFRAVAVGTSSRLEV